MSLLLRHMLRALVQADAADHPSEHAQQIKPNISSRMNEDMERSAPHLTGAKSFNFEAFAQAGAPATGGADLIRQHAHMLFSDSESEEESR